ncbi:MAG: DUF2520 domain-containing protein [Bacteroidales bacterium]|nr:DUF2520 domain-containing protein [Bacteroidales bacterium]MCF8402405.1 DUF2520 domain-containing protein [Bacteroidales bacterium]
MQTIRKVVVIGAGNVATQLSFALEYAGLQIIQVYSRTSSSAEKLGNDLYTDFTTDIKKINSSADLYILALSDDANRQFANDLSLGDKLVVHTSGSLELEDLKGCSSNYGVFYPLQTFSKTRKIEFKDIPVCIEANSPDNLKALYELASKVSNNVREVTSDQRHQIHLAAVFACNFPNYMFTIAQKVMQPSGIDFEILKPLIRETAEKIQKVSPLEAQTGPARRKDTAIMERHIHLLNKFPEYKHLYQLISEEIGNQYE